MTENDSFQELLLKSFNENNNNNTETCLITQEYLKDNPITLPNCKHKFNYDSIYEEVVKQKIQNNSLETQKLGLWQIKCPYCRDTVPGILPYRENKPKTRYVNWPWEYCFIKNFCKYTFSSGKKKGKTCNKICENDYCKNHTKVIYKRIKKQEEKEKKKHEFEVGKDEKLIEKMTVKELKNYCKIYKIKKYSTLRKKELLLLLLPKPLLKKSIINNSINYENTIVTI
jgi:hypothetical protein